MRARHRLSKMLMRHGIQFDDGRAWTDRHQGVAEDRVLGMAGGADDAARPGGRDRCAGPPPRSPGAGDRLQPARLAVGEAGRTAALLARCRHADCGRVVRRDRRLRTIRPCRAADELSRPGPVRVNDREQSPARVDHEDRIGARPPAARPSGLALPQSAGDPQDADRPTDRQAGQPAEAVAIACSAQRRLHRTWARLEARNKRRTIIAVAAARELIGFCWAITQTE